MILKFRKYMVIVWLPVLGSFNGSPGFLAAAKQPYRMKVWQKINIIWYGSFTRHKRSDRTNLHSSNVINPLK